ncbi:SDR family NAD(P)-dependent oxidoreductase, partial [Mycetohabitans sp. B6]|uniref:SDR family NAD(P)-dependent oxidoreductase n=1 Tax=Mycetohabitans sp. B6 TaxID=2841843 RepID=UPI00351CCD67
MSASAPELLSETQLAMFDDLLMKPIRIDALAFNGDLQDAAQIDQLIQDVFAHFGRLDLLVNNAA